MAMTAQEYLDNFNTAINAGAYDSAASILKAAEGDFGPGVYDVAGVVLEANASLPPEIDFMSPQGIQSIRDYVNTATAPPAEIQRMQAQRAEAELLRRREAERPIVDPRLQPVVAAPVNPTVEEFNSLIRTGNFKQAAEFAQSQGFTPDQVATYINENAANLGLPAGFGVTGENIATLYPGYVAPAAATVAKSFDEQLNELANQNLGRSLTASEMETYRTDFRGELNDANISDFLKRSQKEIDQVKTARDIATKAADTAAANAAGRPGPDQVLGTPRFAAQTPSALTFAPLRRGLAQLRPAMYMPGLTSGQAPLGGSGFTPESLRNAIKSMTAAGQTPADVAYQMDVGGVSPAELSAAIGTPVGQIQGAYNQSRPRGLFSTVSPRAGPTFKDTSQLGAFNTAVSGGDLSAAAQIAQRAGFSPSEAEAYVNANLSGLGLKQPIAPGGIGSLYGPNVQPNQNFALQTGAYGAATPTFLNRTSTTTGNIAGAPFPSGPSNANANQTGFSSGVGSSSGDGSDSIQGDPNSKGINVSGFLSGITQSITDALGLTPTPVSMTEEGMQDQDSGGAGSGATGSGAASGNPGGGATSGAGLRTGGLTKMAEGGESPKMPKLSAAEAGSTFDISEFIDDQGRLVGGYSKPIYDENRVITGYDYRPYERDVVFGRELREKEAAMRLTDAEREQMMVEMAMRQGRTGISPTTGGLAGISANNLMPSYMRRQPQYYSPAEQFRPRYAEGGLASVAQNLADKGRKGDSMLVHMTPDEVAGLQALAQQMGGSLTVNPQTGLPEANFFKKLLPMALGFALGPAGIGGGIFKSALTAGLAVGAGYTLATGSLQQGISAGLGAYGGANLGTGLQAAGTADAATSAAASEATGTGINVAGAAGGDAASAAMVESQLGYGDTPFNSFGQTGIPSLPPADYSLAAPGAVEGMRLGTTSGFQASLPEVSNVSLTSADPTATSFETGLGGGVTPTAPPATPGSALTGAERYLGDKATRDLAAQRYADATGSTLGTSAMQIVGGAAGQSAADAEKEMEAQQAAIFAKRDERKRRFEELFGRTLGSVPARSGGLMKLAGGGMTYMEAGGTTGPTGAPRDVTGTGDGMSDSVPASIEGVQEARLADGEFVIPADVVADIGNGSSDAGSKKLYDMMDRIRRARHGTTEQPPEIQAERLMPA